MDLFEIRNKLNQGISLTEMKLRVTAYVRVSTDHLEQKSSLKNQIEHFDNYIKENPCWEYVPSYIDDGISGTSDIKRDNFMRMIDNAKKGFFDLIVTKEISRFSRNTLDSIKYTRELLSYGVAVLFLNDNINTALPDSELRLTIMASMAQDEIRRLSERVKFGMNRAIKRGEILGNNLLYGYEKDKINKKLKIIEEEAMIVRDIFTMYGIDGLSLNKIAKYLNNKGILTKYCNKWSATTLLRMLRNPKYKGYYCGKKSEVVDYMTKKIKYFQEDKWVMHEDYEKIPPIVTASLWNLVNKKLKNNKKSGDYRKKYVYTSKIKCGGDQAFFHRRIFCKNQKEITWVCSKYLELGKHFCDTPNIRESELNIIMKGIMASLKVGQQNVVNFLKKIYQENKNVDEEKSVKDYQKNLHKLKMQKEKLLELSLNNLVSLEEFKKKNDELNEKIKSLNNYKINIQNVDLNNLFSKITEQEINEIFLKHLLKVIEVSKIDKAKYNLHLKIFLTTTNNLIKKYQYKFLRRDKCSKKFWVFYNVVCYY